MNIPSTVVLVGLVVFLGHALEDLFARSKVPDVLLLLFLGLLIGPVFQLVGPESFGAVGPVFTTVTLVVILFESGLGLDLGLLLRSLRGATLLTLLNFLATLLVVTPVARLFLGLGWLGSLSLGAILAGTSSAVVIPLVRRLSIGDGTRTVLALESALSDVMVIVVALGLMEAQKAGELYPGALLGGMAASFLVASLLGIGAGLLWSMTLDRIHGLQNSIFTTPAYVLVVFGLTELMGYSGAIAALSLGVMLGNTIRIPMWLHKLAPVRFALLSDTEVTVFAEVVFLLKTFFFIYIGLSLHVSGWLGPVVGIGLTLSLFAARVPVVHLSLPASRNLRRDAMACGIIVPKGLAAAVVATIPSQLGLPGADQIRNTTYAVVFLSILATSGMVFLLEQGWLGGLSKFLFQRYAPGRDEPPSEPEGLNTF